MVVTELSTMRHLGMNISSPQNISFIDSNRLYQSDAQTWNFRNAPTATNPPIVEVSDAAACSECNEKLDYMGSTCVYRCSNCKKNFHEWCRTNWEPCIDVNQWFCKKCKDEKEKKEQLTGIIDDFDDRKNDTEDVDGKYLHNLRPIGDKLVAKNAVFEKIDQNTFDSKLVQNNIPRLEEAACTNNNGKILSGGDTAYDNLNMDTTVDKVVQQFLHKMNNRRRKNICTVVPPMHFGPIPGIPVGSCWKFRIQVSESGIHRPLVAGIAGRGNTGAVSIVLSGVYEDDYDLGDEFYYSGCGGKRKDPNKRLCVQIADQELTRHNRALALCCNTPLNLEGARATNWRDGKPVRVVRNYKLKRFSKYAPNEGNRYDGIYKVVEYFPIQNKLGLRVWRYLMRRDDIEPAPWTDEGKRLIEQRNLKIIYPVADDLAPMNPNWIMRKEAKKRKQSVTKNFTSLKQTAGCEYDESTSFSEFEYSRYDVKPNISTMMDRFDHNTSNNNVRITSSYLNSSSMWDSTNTILIHENKSDVRTVSEPTNPTNLLTSTIEIEIEDSRYDLKPNISTMTNHFDHDTLNNNVQITSSYRDAPSVWHSATTILSGENKFDTCTASQSMNPSTLLTSTIEIDLDDSRYDIKPNVAAMENHLKSKTSDTLNNVESMSNSANTISFRKSKSPDTYTASQSMNPSTIIEIDLDDSRYDIKPNVAAMEDHLKQKTTLNNVESTSISESKSSDNSTTSKPVKSNDSVNDPCHISASLSAIDESKIPFKKRTLHNVSNVESIDEKRISEETSYSAAITGENMDHQLPEHVLSLIRDDMPNKSSWEYCLSVKEFSETVEILFMCPICQKLPTNPVTAPCDHNFCKVCITAHFEKKLHLCPSCRIEWGNTFKVKENKKLSIILDVLFPQRSC